MKKVQVSYNNKTFVLKYKNKKVPTQNLSEEMDVDEPVAVVEIETQQEMETKESKEEETKEETKEDKDL